MHAQTDRPVKLQLQCQRVCTQVATKQLACSKSEVGSVLTVAVTINIHIYIYPVTCMWMQYKNRRITLPHAVVAISKGKQLG